ncbi:MAG: PQQ-dependent sugar dehydrogenase [Flavobacteriales bacterium]|nr:PQQ-dependent sugar dehydrogenase [Flavobacteriales bacterium]
MRRTYLLVWSSSLAAASLAQGTPTALRSDITVEHYMDVRTSVTRMAHDALDDRLWYLRTSGEVLLVVDDGISPPYDTVQFTVADHDIDQTFGIAFHDSDLFLIGNQITGNNTQGLLKRARLQPDGTRIWSTVAITGTYAWGGKGHAFNNVVVSPDAEWLYLNCGSRTDHGEVQDVDGEFPGRREDPITAKILRIPYDAVDLLLPNDEALLIANDQLFASGVRNTYDMAFDAEDRLFGVENSGDHDDPEEMNWLREGHHYGFPWTAGGNMNPTPTAGYDPTADPLLNPGYPAAATDFYYDADFPSPPNIVFTEPILNNGPDADRLRAPSNGGILDASEEGLGIRTFTCHRSPLGLVIDRHGVLDGDLHEAAFALSFTPGGDTTGFSPIAPWGIPVVPADPSEDLLQLDLNYDAGSDNFNLNATRIVSGFYLPVDAELVNNVLYVIENWGNTQRSMWKVTLPLTSDVKDVNSQTSDRLKAWPMPSQDVIYWSYAGKGVERVELLDASGRTIRTLDAALPHGTFTVADIPAGLYLMRATGVGSPAQRTIMVVH